ncbi:MAG: efflux RND transporter permease subunit [Deltaproteobacteria bacterium]|nr:efflux RND transporter permease subunit [Deltaproteobacteria bacterium]
MLMLVVGVLGVAGCRNRGAATEPPPVLLWQARLDGAGVSEIEHVLLQPMEDAAALAKACLGQEGLAREGRAEVRCRVARGGEDAARQALHQAAATLQRQLPAAAEQWLTAPAAPTRLRLMLSSAAHPLLQLGEVAQMLRHRLEALPGVTGVTVCGAPEPEVTIEVDPARLVQYGLGLRAVDEAMRALAVDLPAGRLDVRSGTLSIRTPGKPHTMEELGELTLASPLAVRVRLRDVALLRDGAGRTSCVARRGAGAVVALEVHARAALPAARVADVLRGVPAGVTVEQLHEVAAEVWMHGVGAAGTAEAGAEAVDADFAAGRAVAALAAGEDVVLVTIDLAPALELGRMQVQLSHGRPPHAPEAAVLRALAPPGWRARVGRGTRVVVSGPSEVLADAAELLRAPLGAVAGAGGVYQPGRPVAELRMELDRAALARTGVSVAEVAETLAWSGEGRIVGSILEPGGESRAVRLRVEGGREELLRLPMQAAGGVQVPLGELVRVTQGEAPVVIEHRERQRVVTLVIDATPGVVRKALAGVVLPVGARAEVVSR